MHEVLEANEEHGGHEESPLTIPVSVTLSILAVLVAISTLFAHRSAKEELLLQTQETDQWAFYQAKNSGLHFMQLRLDLLEVQAAILAPGRSPLIGFLVPLAERWAKRVEISSKGGSGPGSSPGC